MYYTRASARVQIMSTDSGDNVTAKRDWRKAQHTIDTLVRLQIARGLAPLFLTRNRPYEENAELSAMIEDRLLHKAAFIQKPPFMLRFYKRLLFAMDEEPRSILEIGVKGGGSTALWKTLFPAATVVGMDIEIRPWLASAPSDDGVIYVQGDQADATTLAAIARQYGPFSVVIDDGSHRIEHQFTTMRCLLPHVRAGGFYVVEDIHASAKQLAAEDGSGGPDAWSDFVLTLFQQRRKGPLPAEAEGTRLALEVAPIVDDLIVARRVLAVRVAEHDAPPERP